ncbi:MAG: sel1 repeat family protein [Porphyromonadaceae bacterium]|jgi:TPR repeat protein|nr:sel1 repeat family protein [Porphyromonadaceae bacterium]
MTKKVNYNQIVSERNTYFSSLLSQKAHWTVEEILSTSKDLLIPFKGLKEDNIESSTEVSMLYDIVYLLPYKLKCYKSVVNALYKNNGMACDDLTINVFNADCGIDSIVFVDSLINKGYEIKDIKVLRLFSSDEVKLKRAILLHKKLYPSIPLEAYNMDIKEISNECKCNSLFTINIFPHTFNLGKDIHKEISRIIIGSHYIYSHSIFFENISSNRMPQVSGLDCSFYWQDLNKARFYQNDSRNFSFDSMISIEGERYYAQYAIFSNLSFETLDIKHEYKIILNGLCPGVPIKTLFNQNRTSLFFDRPFQNKGLCNDVDNTNVVMHGLNYERVWDDTKIDYTLRKVIEDFPQYSISEGLDNNEEWAHEVIAYYLNAAKDGNVQCYNNIGILKSLCNSLSDDTNDIHSERNKEIVDLFMLASKGGDVNAMINLASLYMYLGDYTNAINYYKMASDNGEAAGSYSMGIVYHFGLYGNSKDEEIAIKYYKKSIEQYLKETESDTSSCTPISNCCLNLIILMYENDCSLCDITKEFNKIKKASSDLIYAYTVISNNLSNKAKDFFKVLRLNKSDKDEPAFVTYNRICALYNGIKNGNDSLKSNKALALEQLKKLANTGCPNWPDWEKYVWRTLALWTNKAKESSAAYSTYWIKASNANPKNSCAYRTNMALFSQLDEEEIMSIWHKYAYGNGCETCHECSLYDTTSRCCPKAQFNWARKYEKDPAVAKFLVEAAMRQGYNAALQYSAIDKVKEELMPNVEVNPLDNFLFNWGIVPSAYRQIIHEFTSDSRYKLLCRAADNGSRKAASLLVEVSKLKNSDFEHIYWSALTARLPEQISILQKITNKNFDNDFFRASSLAEQDLITLANKRAEQFIGEKEDVFVFLKTLAEFYVRGELYSKAVELYKIASSKGFDVNKRIDELEEEIERINSDYSYDHDYDYYDEPDYARDTWDAMTDGMYGDMPDGFDGDYDFLGR